MKNSKIAIYFLFIFIIFGCQNLDEINTNPNDVVETDPRLLLTNVAHNTFKVEGRGPLFASRMLILTSEENSEQYYKWNRAGFGRYNQLRNTYKMIEEAERINNEQYKAIGLFLKSYHYYKMALTFGDIPYTNAVQGEKEVYQPAYDSQKTVFEGILSDLEKANTILKKSSSGIIGGDIIYNGNQNNWLRLVNSFRLKVLMTLSKKTGEMPNLITDFKKIANSEELITNNDENGQLQFLNEAGARYSEFNSSGYGSSTYMGESFVELLKQHKDPRLFAIAEQTPKAKTSGLSINNFSSYKGGNEIGAYSDAEALATQGLLSKVNPRYYTNPTCEAHNILSYAELELILAEAAVRGWISSNAATHYKKAVKASFNFYSKYADNYAQYLDDNAANSYLSQSTVDLDSASNTEAKIERIINQKYFISFLQGGWNIYFEHLRTGYPQWAIGSNPAPYRWIYPSSEYNQNSENVSKAITSQFGSGNDKITSKTWWLK